MRGLRPRDPRPLGPSDLLAAVQEGAAAGALAAKSADFRATSISGFARHRAEQAEGTSGDDFQDRDLHPSGEGTGSALSPLCDDGARELALRAARYAGELGHAPIVAAAFAIAGIEPPPRSTIDARGFSFAERKVLNDFAAA